MAKKVYVGGTSRKQANGLPIGYTQVEYIQSNGTQYIDTGFKPKYNSRVVIDIEGLTNNSSSPGFLFGTRNTASSGQFSVYRNKDTEIRSDYMNTQATLAISDVSARSTVDKNKNVATLFGKTITNTAETSGQCSYNLFLFALDDSGSAILNASMKLYSCKIYDNGTLVRDFVPCKNTNMECGLYDKVNDVFYANAGTGSFLSGSETPVDFETSTNVALEVKKIYTGVNGIARENTIGYIGVNGVARKFWEKGTPLGEFAVGSTVKLNVNGTPREFIIVNQGIPSNSALYDSSCNGTWLLMKDLYEKNRAWDSSNNDYENSDIHAYLNSTFLNVFDSKIQSTIKLVKIPYRKGTGSSGTTATGSSGLSTKIFLLSGYEVGWTTSDHSYFPVDGACLSYFNGSNAVSNRIGYYNGTASSWLLRSPYTGDNTKVYRVYANGTTYNYGSYTLSYGVRPALVLPFDTFVPHNLLITG